MREQGGLSLYQVARLHQFYTLEREREEEEEEKGEREEERDDREGNTIFFNYFFLQLFRPMYIYFDIEFKWFGLQKINFYIVRKW